jgi:hypothetical protein
MLTLLSTMISFLMGGLPKLLDFFQDRSNKGHELALMSLQTEKELAMVEKGYIAQQKVEEIRTDQIQITAETRKAEILVEERKALLAHDVAIGEGASRWVINMRASVRPLITYIFVFELVAINIAIIIWGWTSNLPFSQVIDAAFTNDEMLMLSSIVAFWFGGQAFSSKK